MTMSVHNITPEDFQCVAASCPAIYSSDEDDKIIIVGKTADLEQAGLTEEVGDDEEAVVVSAEMLKQADLDQ